MARIFIAILVTASWALAACSIADAQMIRDYLLFSGAGASTPTGTCAMANPNGCALLAVTGL